MKIKLLMVPLAVLCLGLEADAIFNFGNVLNALRGGVEGVGYLVNSILGQLSAEELGILEESMNQTFKAELIAVNALCQAPYRADNTVDEYPREQCKKFGQRYIKKPGVWGCGKIAGERDFACSYHPGRPRMGVRLAQIDFVDERDNFEARWIHGGQSFFYHGRQKTLKETYLDDEDEIFYNEETDEIEPGIDNNSEYYADMLVADLQKYESTFKEATPESDVASVGLAVETIVQTLNLAGIRYPIGKKVCQLCKGTCNVAVPASSRDKCKYEACVKFLGGYKGSDSRPSCRAIPRP
ncbi:hypothetical protein EC973_007898 [Apophysomyces ossiformis]|uniref:Uncharacterized protein n=1 Tax=Apophysomyces ossiformis TaxID=679940 RepID=A0A8H7BTB3_9FUNG|nr:hypothetical protein EC973_007898 [Apophysomyces ossiformis]